MEFLGQHWQTILLYAPLGVIGIWRWVIWITKKIIGFHYKSIENTGFNTTLSIVTPVYNENPRIFHSALESWKNNDPDEIIAVIDYTDKACIEEFNQFAKTFNKAKLIITEKSGKRPALADGVKVASSEIIALVDSDTIWDPNSRPAMLAPFADFKVGGVGTRQDVLETDTLARRIFNIHLDHRYFDEMPFLARAGDAVTCLSGRTALYRREAILPVVDEMVAETFWGKQCISGEDKCLTRLVQAQGWKARYQMNIRVRTPGFPGFVNLLQQYTRWMRNSWRSDIKSLSSRWIWREKFLAFHMIDRFIQPFTLLLGPIYFVFSIIWGHWLVAGILIVWWHFSRGIKLYPHLKHRPSDILILPVYIFTTYLLAILKIYTLVTMNQQGWITRWDKSRLQVEGNVIFKALRAIAPWSVTASMILLLSFGVVKYRDVTATASYTNNTNNVKSSNLEKSSTSQQKQIASDDLKDRRSKYYTVENGDILSEIAWRHNRSLSAVIKANRKIVRDPNYIYPGQSLFIPALKSKNISVSKVQRMDGTSSNPAVISSTPSTIISPPVSTSNNPTSVSD